MGCTQLAVHFILAPRAIVFNRIGGIKDTVYAEGTHLMVPWLERPIIYDVRARPNVITSTSGSRDLQMVRVVYQTTFA